MEVLYDRAWRVQTFKDAVAVKTPAQRGRYTFYVTGNSRGERVDPLNGEYTAYYDRRGRAIQFIDEVNRVVNSVPDNYDRVNERSFPEGNQVQFRYDTLHNVKELDFVDDTYLGATNYRTDYGYDPAGNRTSIAYPGGGTFSYSYDALNQMDVVTEGGITLVDYKWDTLSRRELAQFNNYGFQSSYGYEDDDDLNSLAQTGPSPLTFTMVRNNVSQITSLTASNGAFLAKPAMTKADAYNPNHLNQYTQVGGASISSDANGNVTGDGTYTFAYDVENRLMSAVGAGNTVSYQYDPLGRRRAKIVNNVTTKYVSDGAEEIEERDASNAVLRKYAYGPSIDDRIAMKDSTGAPVTCAGAQNWCFYLTNWQGSTTTLINQSGSVKDTYHYGPYGERVNWDPTDPDTGNPFRYTGRRYDPETGLYYYRARYYSPKWGRFLQTDPIGTRDDMNLYAYVGNEPIDFRDETGEGKKWVGHLVTLYGKQMKTVAKVSKEQAVRLRRKGENILARTRQKAHEIEAAAHGEENLVRHSAHEEGFRPHFQTAGRLGHTFWTAAGAAILAGASALDGTAQAATTVGNTLEENADLVSDIAGALDPVSLLKSPDMPMPAGYREGPFGSRIKIKEGEEGAASAGQSSASQTEKATYCTGSHIAGNC